MVDATPILSAPRLERILQAALDAVRRAGEIHRAHFRSDGLVVERKADATPVTVADRVSEQIIRETLRRATPELGLLGEEFGAEGPVRDRWVIDPIDGTESFVAGLPHFATLLALELDGAPCFGLVHAPVLSAERGSARPLRDVTQRGLTWWAATGHGAYAGLGTDRASVRGRRLRARVGRDLALATVSHGDLTRFHDRGLLPALLDVAGRAGRTRGYGDWWGHVLVAEGRCDAMLDPAVRWYDVAALIPILTEAGAAMVSPPSTARAPGPAVSATPALIDELSACLACAERAGPEAEARGNAAG